jgi:hypothetical protein
MSTRRVIAAGVCIAAGAGVAFCASLVVGWFSAWGDVLGLNAPASAAYSAAALKELRRGNSDQALSMLGLSFDGYFIDRWTLDQSKHPDAGVQLAVSEIETRYAKQEGR